MQTLLHSLAFLDVVKLGSASRLDSLDDEEEHRQRKQLEAIAECNQCMQRNQASDLGILLVHAEDHGGTEVTRVETDKLECFVFVLHSFSFEAFVIVSIPFVILDLLGKFPLTYL